VAVGLNFILLLVDLGVVIDQSANIKQFKTDINSVPVFDLR
jgi:hypothetical protein